MGDDPLVSIIIPVYNTPEKYLRACLESVERQEYKNTEVIIVDDGSDHSTVERIGTLVSDAKNRAGQNWHVIHRKNGGLSAARNTGYDAAKGKYVQFLDSDDYFDPKLISSAVERAEETAAEIVIENFELHDVQATTRAIAINPDHFPKRKTFQLTDMRVHRIGIVPYSTWSKLFRKDFLDSLGIRHDEELRRAEDVLFSFTALVQAKKITLLSDPYITYLENLPSSNSVTNDKFPLDSVKSWKKLYALLNKLGLYTTYKEDFEPAMVGGVFWHLERLHTLRGIQELGKAARKFMDDDMHMVALSDEAITIQAAAVSPEVLMVLGKKNKQIQALQERLQVSELRLNSVNVELDSLRRPGVRHASRKLAGALKRQAKEPFLKRRSEK